ncbi:MAG: hypothetical protein WA894_04470 [Candidatus Acidiferrum sp.]
MSNASDPARQLLRHTVATVAYRGGKTLRGAPASFASFANGENARSPAKIVSHLSDLFDWALSMARGENAWRNSESLPWDAEVARFFASLKAFDDFLATSQPLHATPENLFQGPVADALTHVGQLAMLRRLAGCPMKSENYFKAEIAAGRVGAEQTPSQSEFD